MRNPVKTIRDNFAIRSFEKDYTRTAKLIAPYIEDGTKRPSEINGLRIAFTDPAKPKTIEFKTQFMDDNDNIKAVASIRMPPSGQMLDVIALRLAAEKLKRSVQWTKAQIEGREFIADREAIANEPMPNKHTIADIGEIMKMIILRAQYDEIVLKAQTSNVTDFDLDIPGIEDLPEFDELNMMLSKSMASQHHAVFDIQYS